MWATSKSSANTENKIMRHPVVEKYTFWHDFVFCFRLALELMMQLENNHKTQLPLTSIKNYSNYYVSVVAAAAAAAFGCGSVHRQQYSEYKMRNRMKKAHTAHKTQNEHNQSACNNRRTTIKLYVVL